MPERPFAVETLMRVPVLGRHVKRSHDSWLRERCRRYWESEDSPARLRHQAHPQSLTSAQERVLADLRATGVAHAPFTDLAPEAEWDELAGVIDRWRDSEEVRSRADAYAKGGYENDPFKQYLVKLYGFNPKQALSPANPLLRMGVSSALLGIVNAYMGMTSILRYVDAWYTIAVAAERPFTGSQCWHRDPEDERIAKVFLYFSDVDAETGALEYVKNSRAGERYGSLWPHRVPSGARAPTDGVAEKVAREDIEVCSHPRGTFVFVDTTGLHRGGRALTRERVFACWEYVSPAAPFPRSFTTAWPADRSTLTPAAVAALNGR